MATYAGVAFSVERDGKGFTPFWHREKRVNRRGVPYANKDIVQYGGKGNWLWKGVVFLASEDDYYTLEAASGDGEGRSLADFLGKTHAGVRLSNVTRVTRNAIGDDVPCEVEFERSA